jgi:hypothetical protein
MPPFFSSDGMSRATELGNMPAAATLEYTKLSGVRIPFATGPTSPPTTKQMTTKSDEND